MELVLMSDKKKQWDRRGISNPKNSWAQLSSGISIQTQ